MLSKDRLRVYLSDHLSIVNAASNSFKAFGVLHLVAAKIFSFDLLDELNFLAARHTNAAPGGVPAGFTIWPELHRLQQGRVTGR